MGNWFENMEPMNIQEERANTKRERKRADQAEEERDKAEKSLIDLMKKVYGTKDIVVENLVESYDKTEDEAQKLVEKYW